MHATASVAGLPEEESRLPPEPKRRSPSETTPQRSGRRRLDNGGIIPVLARAGREVEGAGGRGRLTSAQRAQFQAVAMLARAERTRVRADSSRTETQRDAYLKRLDGIGAILARIAAREPSLFSVLEEDAEVSESARRMLLAMQQAAGLETTDDLPAPPAAEPDVRSRRQTVPQSVVAAQLANPFLAPDSGQATPVVRGHLAGWELVGPLLNAFEH